MGAAGSLAMAATLTETIASDTMETVCAIRKIGVAAGCGVVALGLTKSIIELGFR